MPLAESQGALIYEYSQFKNYKTPTSIKNWMVDKKHSNWYSGM